MGYFDYLKTGFEIVKLNRREISNAANDEQATRWSMLTVVLVAVVYSVLAGLIGAAVGSMFGSLFGKGAALGSAFGLGIFVFQLVATLVMFFLMAGILVLVSRMFGSQGSFMNLVRPLGLAYPLNILSLVPLLGILASIWSLVVMAVTVSETQKLSIGKSIGVLVISIVAFAIIFWLLFMVVFAGLFAAAGTGALLASQPY